MTNLFSDVILPATVGMGFDFYVEVESQSVLVPYSVRGRRSSVIFIRLSGNDSQGEITVVAPLCSITRSRSALEADIKSLNACLDGVTFEIDGDALSASVRLYADCSAVALGATQGAVCTLLLAVDASSPLWVDQG